ncbi:MAG: hypothetical protein H5T98_07865 [Syntrophomonadaceae bacterium]|nr:hypothetical protein [Syntrophomonadaceae bacterium]
MFFTFLNKDRSHYLDLSVLTVYNPQQVLYYYYNSPIKISFNTYFQIKDLAEAENSLPLYREWLDLFANELEASADLDNLKDNEYIDLIGPYYYPKYNARFYFAKNVTDEAEYITSQDLDTIISLDESPSLNEELQAYNQNKKNNKKTARSKNELIKNIDMCLTALKEIEHLNKHINYLKKFLEQRYEILNQQDELSPVKPDNLPEKPHKAKESKNSKANPIAFNIIRSRQQKHQEKNAANKFNNEMKVYFIRYREYEKACDRYKKALEKWNQDGKDFIDNCSRDIKTAEKKLKNAYKNLQIYNSVLSKSFIHIDYQDIRTLEIFKYFLETGRANDLQRCMNLFEEERHWNEIKASQERIENTIYFLQNENDLTSFAEEHIDHLLKHINEKPIAAIRK